MSGTEPPFDAALHLDAMAATMRLSVTPEQRPGVLQFLTVAQGMATLVAKAPVAEASFELAPVFRPGAGQGDGQDA